MKITTVFLIAFLTMCGNAALAQPLQCVPREVGVKHMEDTYSETLQVRGLDGNNMLVEIYASEENGTWTLTLTRPDGFICLISQGDSYQFIGNKPKPQL